MSEICSDYIVQLLTMVHVKYLVPMRQNINSEIDACYLPTIALGVCYNIHHWPPELSIGGWW